MQTIATLTMNPTIDGACEAEKIFPTHKIRTQGDRYDPGGGGINAARVLARLGCGATAYYLAGGATGSVLDHLLDSCGVARCRIDIAGHTRVAHSVYERSTGQEYRFVPEGPLVSEGEWRAVLDRLAHLDVAWLVASGSLPRGVPDDFYAQVGAIAAAKGAKLILDSSGPALAAALAAGGVFLVKPSAGEFEQLVGRRLTTPAEIGAAAMELVQAGQAAHIAVTMGHLGAVLADQSGWSHLPAMPVEAKSAVGAGDSFLAGMTCAFARGWAPARAFRYGMAAGTAAVLTPGTDLCHKVDIERLFAEIEERG